MKVRYQHFKNQESEYDSVVEICSLDGNKGFIHHGAKLLYSSILHSIEDIQSKEESTDNGIALLESLSVVTSEVIDMLALAAKQSPKYANNDKFDLGSLRKTMEVIYDNFLWTNLENLKNK